MGLTQTTSTMITPVVTAQPVLNEAEMDVSIPIVEPAIEIVVKSEPESSDDWGYMNIGYGVDSRWDVHDMYMTVKKLGLEEWIKNYDSRRDRYSKESDLISDNLENNGHSGASYGGCLWAVSKVFNDGWTQGYTNR